MEGLASLCRIRARDGASPQVSLFVVCLGDGNPLKILALKVLALSMQMPFSCGGCTWDVTDGVLSMTGAPDCGSGCYRLYFSSLSISSIDPGAFNSTGLSAVTYL